MQCKISTPYQFCQTFATVQLCLVGFRMFCLSQELIMKNLKVYCNHSSSASLFFCITLLLHHSSSTSLFFYITLLLHRSSSTSLFFYIKSSSSTSLFFYIALLLYQKLFFYIKSCFKSLGMSSILAIGQWYRESTWPNLSKALMNFDLRS